MKHEPPNERLLAWRKRAGLSQLAAAQLVEQRTGIQIRQASWSRIEAGRQVPGRAIALALAKVTRGQVAAADWPPVAAGKAA